jgi:hypothetical protein
MTTLNIHGLNVRLLIWLWTTLNVPNYLDASQIITLCQGNHTNFDPSPSASKNFTSPPPSSSGESITNSNQKS